MTNDTTVWKTVDEGGIPLVQRNWVEKPLQFLSYGGGVQSTAMLIMIELGLLPKPDLVIHSDTGSEMPHTENFIQIARKYVEEVLEIPFVVVRSHLGSIYDHNLSKGWIPMIGLRSCTDNFKIVPQRKYIRSVVGRGGPRGALLAEGWLGITTDEESRRVEGTGVKWSGITYPLLDIHRMSREDCVNLNLTKGWKVQKSGCFFCPYMSKNSWKAVREDHPDLFEMAIVLEENKREKRGGKWGLHQATPLRELDSAPATRDSHGCAATDGGCFL
jgi:hypothetical protein